jgi:hypothetical protein
MSFLSLSDNIKKLWAKCTNYDYMLSTLLGYQPSDGKVITPDGNKYESPYDYTDAMDQLNLPPKVGYFGETEVPLIATFDMGYNGGDYWAISDSQGRELLYYNATDKPGNTYKYFQAYRMGNTDFIYNNNPIIPGYAIKNGWTNCYVSTIYGLGSYFMVARVVYTSGGQTYNRVHLINTLCSGSANAWTLIKDITDIFNSFSVAVRYKFLLIEANNQKILACYGLKSEQESGSSGSTSTTTYRYNIVEDLWRINPIGTPDVHLTASAPRILVPNLIVRTDTTAGGTTTTSFSSDILHNDEFKIYAVYFYAGNAVWNTAPHPTTAQPLNKLSITCILYIKVNNVITGANTSAYHTLYFDFNCTPSHFLNNANIVNTIPKANYKIMDSSMESNIGSYIGIDGDSTQHNITFDELDNKIRQCWHIQNHSLAELYVFDGSQYDVINRPYPYWSRNTRYIDAVNNIQSIDICPWAKGFFAVNVRGENLYITSEGNKPHNSYWAGQRIISYVEDQYESINSTYANNNSYNNIYIKRLMGGTWWILAEHNKTGPSALDVCYKNGSGAGVWYRTTYQSSTKSFIVQRINFTTFVADGVTKNGCMVLDTPIPNSSTFNCNNTGFDSSRYVLYSYWYHPGKNKILCLAYENNVKDPLHNTLEKFHFLLEYDLATKVWKAHKKASLIDEEFYTRAKRSSDNLGIPNAPLSLLSNLFIDTTEAGGERLYFIYSHSAVGGRMCQTLVRCNWSGSDIQYTICDTPPAIGGQYYGLDAYILQSIGYNNKFGYYWSWGYGGFAPYAGIVASKDPSEQNGARATSLYEMMSQNHGYRIRYEAAPSVGCMAVLPQLPVLLNGYFSIIPAQEIMLKKNSVNYIYLRRQLGNRHKLILDVTTKFRGKNDSTSFNQLYVATCTTDNEKAVNIEYGIVDNYAQTDK